MVYVIIMVMMNIHYRNNNMIVKDIDEQFDMDIWVRVFEKDNCSLLREVSS